MRADEIIKQCNPCNCDRGGTIQYEYDILPDEHILKCSYCNFTVIYRDLKQAIDNWNSINIDAPVAESKANSIKDQELAWQQASEMALCGNVADAIDFYENNKTAAQTLHDNTQALAAAMDNAKQALSNVVNSLLVKKTADELPDENVIVLLWHDSQWMPVMRNCVMEWGFAYDAYMISKVNDGQYWLPMPSFSPESE